MKKRISKLLALVMVLVVIVAVSAPALAEATIPLADTTAGDLTTTILVVVAAVAVVLLGMGFVIPWAIKRGVNVSGALSNTSSALSIADSAIDGLTTIFPDMGVLNIADKIIGYAQKGVEAAEKLYLTSQIEATDRKDKALELVYEFVQVAGVEVTPEIKKVIEGCIEAAVFALPKTNKAA